MGFLDKLLKGDAAKKVIDAAKKPENQQKLREAAAKLRDRKNKG